MSKFKVGDEVKVTAEHNAYASMGEDRFEVVFIRHLKHSHRVKAIPVGEQDSSNFLNFRETELELA